MNQTNIVEVVAFDSTYVESINRLLAQLTSRTISFSETDLKEIIDSPNSHLFLLHCEKQVAGMLTIGSYLTPTGRKHWIEDVVVDCAFRNRSLGKRLIEYAIARIEQQGESTLMLTSNPMRIAANKLYTLVGFEHKQTNIYRIQFPNR